MKRMLLLVVLSSAVAFAAPKKPFQAQGASTIAYGVAGDEESIKIQNVSFEATGDRVPGRPADERLVLRKTVRTKEVIGDMGIEATVKVEAWPMGAGLEQKPLYTLQLEGTDVRVADDAVLVASRGTEEVNWWSVHRLGDGRQLLITYAPLLSFSISRDTVKTRYVGMEVPPDDTKDARLKEPHVVGVVTYASADRVIREALVTCADAKKAALLRSFSEMSLATSVVGLPGAPKAIRIVFTQQFPSSPAPVEMTIPLAGDDLNLAGAQLPAGMQASAWKR